MTGRTGATSTAGTTSATSIAVSSIPTIVSRMRPSVPILLIGHTGIGKTSAIAHGVAMREQRTGRRWQLVCSPVLSTADATDFGMPFPVPMLSMVAALSGSKLPDDMDMQSLVQLTPQWARPLGDEPAVILFDEINRASPPVQNVLMSGVFSASGARRIGTQEIHPESVVVAIANPEYEHTVTMDRAMRARFRTLHVSPDYPGFKQWAVRTGKIHPMVIAFLEQNRNCFFNHEEELYPRGWEAVSETLWEGQDDYAMHQLVVGSVMQRAGNLFIAFNSIAGNLPTAEEILDCNGTCLSGKNPDVQYAGIASVAAHILSLPHEDITERLAGQYIHVTMAVIPEFAVAVGDMLRSTISKRLSPEKLATILAKHPRGNDWLRLFSSIA